METAGADLGISPCRWRGRIVYVRPPARQGAIIADGAGMPLACADLGEGSRWRRSLTGFIQPPASQGRIGSDGTGMLAACADLGKGSRWRRGLAIVISPPTGQASILTHRAGVRQAGADLGKGRAGRAGPPKGAIIPAANRATLRQATDMAAGADLDEAQRRGLAIRVIAPTVPLPIRLHCAGVHPTCCHLAEYAPWRAGLAGVVPPPTGQRAIGAQGAGMVLPGADLGKCSGGRRAGRSR
jgi:hypothetical protein